VDLADALYPAFAVQDDDERAAVVTGLLERSAVRPVLLSNGGLHADWVVRDAAEHLFAAAAVALRLFLGAGTGAGDRLGTCADQACADAFVDSSPGGHRRFCSTTCQNRARAASFRRRHRRAESPSDATSPTPGTAHT
jgi:predicted RNA-binding Zn ribbon-like protein